jgi:hypothetical protein
VANGWLTPAVYAARMTCQARRTFGYRCKERVNVIEWEKRLGTIFYYASCCTHEYAVKPATVEICFWEER